MMAGTEVLLLVVWEGSRKMANGVSRGRAGAGGLRRNIVLVANYHNSLLHGTHPEDCWETSRVLHLVLTNASGAGRGGLFPHTNKLCW